MTSMHGFDYQCPVCRWESHDQYMITDKCWLEAGLLHTDNPHLPCLEFLLARRLVRADFTDAPINDHVFARFERMAV